MDAIQITGRQPDLSTEIRKCPEYREAASLAKDDQSAYLKSACERILDVIRSEMRHMWNLLREDEGAANEIDSNFTARVPDWSELGQKLNWSNATKMPRTFERASTLRVNLDDLIRLHDTFSDLKAWRDKIAHVEMVVDYENSKWFFDLLFRKDTLRRIFSDLHGFDEAAKLNNAATRINET